ncbi:hypothetical protein AVEN_248245-1 [Araneus ventricosus]|uniref:Reverse transcriptase RNase H-like domain-containing protein n=1 Tax=Araneus ventricosus TaxID=182803 RepID=A0A4Y2KV99_ARAVE|nr:hypothetical protein AVEN_248245-1 [Araneus ventricosus]
MTRGPPVPSRPRRLSPEKLVVVKKEFKGMVENGNCRPSNSAWSSPIHLVPKGHNESRICGDYRLLNTECRPDFPRFSDETLSGKPCFAYLDDILVALSDEQLHLSDLEKGFERLNERGLVLNTNKCILGVNISDVGIGALLQLQIGSDIKPLAFFSQRLTPTKTMYSTYDRELLAVYSAIKRFAYTREGREFTVYRDLKPLSFALHQKHDKISPHQQRHLDFISQFTRDIRFISGSDNFVADASSRISEIQIHNEINYAAMAEAQWTDKELEELKKNSSLSFKRIEFPGSNLAIKARTSPNVYLHLCPAIFSRTTES